MPRDSEKSTGLRKHGETLPNAHGSSLKSSLGEQDQGIRKNIHDAELHAVELGLLNDELRRTRDQLETTRDRFQDLYDFAPIAYFTLSEPDIVKNVNVAGAQLLGLARAIVIGNRFISYVAEEDRSLFQDAMHDLLHCVETHSLELKIAPPHKTLIHTRVDMAKTREMIGGSMEYRLVVSDISERKLLEQQREMFFSVASHELRTPITNIAIALDMILQTEAHRLPADVVAKLNIACRGTKRLKRLMEDILGLRNLKSANMQLKLHVLNLAPLMEEAVKLNSPIAEKNRVTLSNEPFNAVAMVNSNEARLLQVLNNLLVNAIKFSPENACVRVYLVQKGGMYRVVVEDQGPGVPAALGQRIFEPFTQGKPSLEDPMHKESNGLGLSISREIIIKLGGRLDYANRAKGGASFFFDLPVYEPGTTTGANTDSPSGLSRPPTPPGYVPADDN